MKLTNLLFSRDILFSIENDYKKVIALNDIPKGTLILVEHVMIGSFTDLKKLLEIDTWSKDELYPRNGNNLSQKIKYNHFSSYDDILALGVYKSWFNSSDHFNVVPCSLSYDKEGISLIDHPICFGGIITAIDIKKDEELYLYYDHFNQPKKDILERYLYITNNLFKQVSNQIRLIIKPYFLKDTFHEIYRNTVKILTEIDKYWGNNLKISSSLLKTNESGTFLLLDEYKNKLIEYSMVEGKLHGKYIIYTYDGTISTYNLYEFGELIK